MLCRWVAEMWMGVVSYAWRWTGPACRSKMNTTLLCRLSVLNRSTKKLGVWVLVLLVMSCLKVQDCAVDEWCMFTKRGCTCQLSYTKYR